MHAKEEREREIKKKSEARGILTHGIPVVRGPPDASQLPPRIRES